MSDSAADAARRENMKPATLLEAVADLQDHQDKATSAQGRYRARRKYWQKEGINLKVLDAILVLKRSDESDVQSDERDRLKYAQWLGLDLGFQAELIFEQPAAEDQEALLKFNAGRQGYDAGKRGDPRGNNPFDAGTVAFAAWDSYWLKAADEAFDGGAAPRQPKKGRGAEAKGKGKKNGDADSPGSDQPPAGATTPAAGDPAASDPTPPPAA